MKRKANIIKKNFFISDFFIVFGLGFKIFFYEIELNFKIYLIFYYIIKIHSVWYKKPILKIFTKILFFLLRIYCSDSFRQK